MRTVAFLVATVVLAQQDVGTNVKQPAIDFYDSVSDYFRQTRRAVDLIVKKGIADEEIPAVLYIARRSSASPNQIIDARKAGKSFSEIANSNNVKLSGSDFVKEANIVFLSEYHGRPVAEIRSMRDKGASFVDINLQLRRAGSSASK